MNSIRIAAGILVGLSVAGLAPLQAQAPSLSGVDHQHPVELPDDLARVLRDYERH